MARYNRWMNDKVYATSALFSDEDRKRDRGAFFKSIHQTLNHILVGDRVWLGRLTGVTPEAGYMAAGIRSINDELFADFEQLRAERAHTDTQIEAWAANVSAAELGGELRYTSGGKARAHPMWWAALQMFNHQTHHRGQVTTLFTQAGHDVGSTDVFAMLLSER